MHCEICGKPFEDGERVMPIGTFIAPLFQSQTPGMVNLTRVKFAHLHHFTANGLSQHAHLCAHGAILCAPCGFIPDSWQSNL